MSNLLQINGGFFKSRTAFEKATLNFARFAAFLAVRKKRVPRKCARFLGKETARGLSKLTEF
jgi:hypothetical protein